MDNGILRVTLSTPDGHVTGVAYNGIENLLEKTKEEDDRGYWDLVWSESTKSGTTGTRYVITGTQFKVILEDVNQVEISFKTSFGSSSQGKLPLEIDKRFIMRRGISGFYSYAIYVHAQEWPSFKLDETRLVFKLWKEKFHYMAIADDLKRIMPMPEDRDRLRGQVLAYPEAVLLINPTSPDLKREYQYSIENKDNRVHGWICSDPAVGFWMIMPSDEFKTGSPVKQELTSHVGPINLAGFVSAHYGGEDLVLKFGENEAWKKVFGPVFIYLNSGDAVDVKDSLWADAKAQMLNEVNSWPYGFVASKDFPPSEQRGSVGGRLLVRDRYVDKDDMPANSAYVGLALPGEPGSWEREFKGYQFWVKTDENGNFRIKNIRTGSYSLYAWVPGFLGDFKYAADVTIISGSNSELGDMIFEPPRDGPTLWEIGIPDRSAAEFFVPEPNPKYVNKLFVNQPEHRFRQYGLWERYEELYPEDDLVYTIGVSDHRKDWFYAQVPRKTNDGKGYLGTTWQIVFYLDAVEKNARYKLRVALAFANYSDLQVRVNDPHENSPLFKTGTIGKDNAIARHGIHGLYRLFNIDVSGAILEKGKNTNFLTQPKANSAFQGIMYDYIRFEGPGDVASSSSSGKRRKLI